jgi:methylated-DNA--[protein]-cysteine S-methyltransferase
MDYNTIMKTSYYLHSIGILKLTYSKEKIYKIEKVDRFGKYDEKSLFSDSINHEIIEYLNSKRENFSFYNNIEPKGTKFQMTVWNELKNIPYGDTKTYKEIAKSIGKPKAIRAVASAIGKNPIMIIIPCHRVIGSDGKLHGYAYGLDLKKKLLAIEKAPTKIN